MELILRRLSEKYFGVKFVIGGTTIDGGTYNKVELSELYEQFCQALEILSEKLSKME